MKRFYLFTLIVLTSAIFSQGQTIYSTSTGGQWQEPATWVGGVVPTDGNDVVIDGTVVVLNYNNQCKNLTVNQGKWLGGTTGYYGQLTVYEDITNNGGISGGASFDIHGDIINNGTWSDPQFNINLKGTSQTITCSDNSPIGSRIMATDSTTNIYLGSNLNLILNADDACVFENAQLFTEGHTLTVDEGQFNNIRITTNDTLTFNNTILSSVTLNGNYALKGLLYVFQDNVFKGEVHNLEGIINLPGYSTILTIEGNITNYGSIQHSELNLLHNATNYGTWYNQMTKFTGPDEKIIINSSGHPFDGVQIVIENADAVVKCGTNTDISPDHFFLGNATLDCNGYILEANTIFHNGIISNADHIVLHGYYENVSIEGSTHFYGTNNMMFSSLNGTFLNHDTITAPYPQSGNVLSVYGHFMNEGDYYDLYMDLYGNLTNHGEISNNSLIQVKGNDPQFIYISNFINSEVRFLSMVSGDSYQWMKDGLDITGEQADLLLFSTLELTDAGVYKCRITVGGNTVYSREITVNLISGMNEEKALPPGRLILGQNYPNPFKDCTTIEWYSPDNCRQTLKVYDLLGKEVATLVDEYKPAGNYKVEFSVGEISSSILSNSLSAVESSGCVLFMILKAGSFSQAKKIVITR
jgi:hypothetical protein